MDSSTETPPISIKSRTHSVSAGEWATVYVKGDARIDRGSARCSDPFHSQAWVLADTYFSTQIPHVDLGQGARGPSLPPGRHWGSS